MKEQRIIIADCDERVRACLLSAMDQEQGMKVIATTGNGMELLNLIQMHHPDFVIMDLILPWIDGISVLEQIKKEPEIFSRPKIVVLTKLNSEDIIQNAFALDICYYMLKPFHVKLVMDRIRQISKIENWVDLHEKQIEENLSHLYGEKKSISTKVETQKEDIKMTEKPNVENEIMNKISEMGIPHHVKGFRYLESAILLCIQDMNRLNGITKDLYPSIAKQYSTTPSRVERGIRHAIEVACNRSKIYGEHLTDKEELFFLTASHRPTNSEFIAFVADRIRMRLNQSANIVK